MLHVTDSHQGWKEGEDQWAAPRGGPQSLDNSWFSFFAHFLKATPGRGVLTTQVAELPGRSPHKLAVLCCCATQGAGNCPLQKLNLKPQTALSRLHCYSAEEAHGAYDLKKQN